MACVILLQDERKNLVLLKTRGHSRSCYWLVSTWLCQRALYLIPRSKRHAGLIGQLSDILQPSAEFWEDKEPLFEFSTASLLPLPDVSSTILLRLKFVVKALHPGTGQWSRTDLESGHCENSFTLALVFAPLLPALLTSLLTKFRNHIQRCIAIRRFSSTLPYSTVFPNNTCIILTIYTECWLIETIKLFLYLQHKYIWKVFFVYAQQKCKYKTFIFSPIFHELNE